MSGDDKNQEDGLIPNEELTTGIDSESAADAAQLSPESLAAAEPSAEEPLPESPAEEVAEEATAEPPEGSFEYLIAHWSAFTILERRERFAQLHRTEAEELFFNLKPIDQAELLETATPLEKRSWIRLLAPDDVADLIQESSPESRPEMLSLLDAQTRREVTALLAYAEDNAGGLMSSRFVRLRPDMSVDEAISYLRIQAKTQIEIIYYCYVIGADQTLEGIVSLRELFSHPPHKKISEIMTNELVKIPVGMEQEDVAKVFAQYDYFALPVIDEWGHMKGIVTFDDVANVIQEEATEDIQKLGAVQALDAPYLQTDFLELMRKRAGWLTVLFIGEMFTASAMGFFYGEIEKAAVLSLFIPLIISAGGNAGSQASTLLIRSLALGEVRIRDWLRVFLREIGMGAALGVVLGCVGFLRIILWPGKTELYGPHATLIGVTVACSVVGCVLWGTISGSMLPFILKQLRLDPATASAPAVATIVDVLGLVIYFNLAAYFLSGTLL